LLFVHPFPIGDVNADADDAIWAFLAVVGNETARLHPPHLAACTNDPILYAIFAPALTERVAAGLY
jgi:hypothetical protein